MKNPEVGGELPKDPKELLIIHPDRKETNIDMETGEITGLLGTESVGILVEKILSEVDKEKQEEMGKKLIDAIVAARIVEPSHWDEKLDYPKKGHEDGFSFKWVNHYPNEEGMEHKFLVRYEGWQEVAQNLHVLTKEIPALKEYAEKMIEERENQ